ncbi:MAG: hypothetical protein KKG02_05825 [Candidatus Edwardsbacteria bacterium]|nr:hypothetical protein [Candidatus Edwardsbacteria bacterium]MBU2594048.1 hypothetical protein [Candidatus Edwardsbacteria bacterium]
MRKAFLGLACLALLLSGGVSFATQSAQSSLGPAVVFTTDPGDIWLFPTELNSYPRLLSLELDSFPFDRNRMSFWGTWSDDEQKLGTVGIGFGDLTNQKELEGMIASLNYAISNHPLMSPRNSIPLPGNKFHLFYARDMGLLVAGLHIARATGDKSYDFSDTIPADAVKRQAHSGIWSFDAGASRIFGDNIYLQTGLGFQTISFSSEFELSGADPLYWEKVESREGSGKKLDARLFYGMTPAIKIVPALSFNSFTLGYTASYADTMHMPGSMYDKTGGKYSQSGFAAYLGTEYCPKPGVKLLAGLSLEGSGIEISDSNNIWLISTIPSQKYISREVSTIVLPGFQAGIEAGLLKWLTLRLGASQKTSWINSKTRFAYNATTTEEAFSESDFNICFGLGFNFGRLTIDAQLNEEQPYNMGYLLSGNPDAPFAKISLKYSY